MIRTASLIRSLSRNSGGLYESVRRLMQSIGAIGFDVRVFGVEDEHTAADIGAWAPVYVKAFSPVGFSRFGYSPQFLKELEIYAPDIIHTHGLWDYPSLATTRYCTCRSTPYVISAHGMLDPWAIKNSYYKKLIARFLYEGAHLRRASCLRALCESEAHSIRKLGLRNPIAIIPNGIDIPKISRLDKSCRSESNGSDPNCRKIMLYLGRIHPKKGLVNLLKAWAACRNSRGVHHSEWILAIAGWDQNGHEAELKKLASELGLAWTDSKQNMRSDLRYAIGDHFSVVFLGPQFQEAKAACYANCDAFILPSFSEGLPMVVLEAWAYGKPVLMTPECNLPCGFINEAAIRIDKSPESITRGLHELFELSDNCRATLGINGLRLVDEHFSWTKVGSETAGLYQWILGGGNKPDFIADF